MQSAHERRSAWGVARKAASEQVAKLVVHDDVRRIDEARLKDAIHKLLVGGYDIPEGGSISAEEYHRWVDTWVLPTLMDVLARKPRNEGDSRLDS